MVTHGQSSDPFWSIVANGVDDAARAHSVRAEYQAPPSFDMERMNNLIEAAVASKPAALVVSIPDASALSGSIRAAVAAGIPVLSINAGVDAWQQLGVLAHIGQTEHGAGFGAGEKLAAAGAKRVLCVNHEVGNHSLDERCRGLADALRAKGGSTSILAVDLADPDDAQQRVRGALASDPTIDGVLTLGPAGAVPTLAAVRAVNRPIRFGTFDLDPNLLDAIRSGEVLFAIDQQPYLQGYLAVVLAANYLKTRTMAGGGDVVRTGPSFVTKENVDAVAELSRKGIR